jgi:uncharacterized protein YjbI with pentapeptide repeats
VDTDHTPEDAMKVALNLYFSDVSEDQPTRVLDTLRRIGATHVGSLEHATAPIDELLRTPQYAKYAEQIAFRGIGSGGTFDLAPYGGIAIRWRDANALQPALDQALTAFDRLLDLEHIDFAVVHWAPNGLDEDTLDGFRTNVLCECPPSSYALKGPVGIGVRTAISSRVMDLMEASSRQLLAAAGSARGDLTVIGDASFALTDAGKKQRETLDAALVASGVAMNIAKGPYSFEGEPADRWSPLEQRFPEPASDEDVLEQLTSASFSNGDKPAMDIEANDFIAPFAQLRDINVEELELEAAVLAFADLSASVIAFSGLVEADLRGVDARDAQFIEVSFHGADLRWATCAKATMPTTRLDNANCAEIDLSGVSKLESAEHAIFDRARAERWAPGAALMTGASFRGANLRHANFAGAQLQNACFDGADLTNANLRGADLRQATFVGATLTNTDLTEAKLEGTGLE